MLVALADRCGPPFFAVEALLGRLGRDWLGVDRNRSHELLDQRRGGLNALLMNQHVAAGLGNLPPTNRRAHDDLLRANSP